MAWQQFARCHAWERHTTLVQGTVMKWSYTPETVTNSLSHARGSMQEGNPAGGAGGSRLHVQERLAQSACVLEGALGWHLERTELSREHISVPTARVLTPRLSAPCPGPPPSMPPALPFSPPQPTGLLTLATWVLTPS